VSDSEGLVEKEKNEEVSSDEGEESERQIRTHESMFNVQKEEFQALETHEAAQEKTIENPFGNMRNDTLSQDDGADENLEATMDLATPNVEEI
jgi:hypothetical protein